MLESLFSKFAEIKSEILLNEWPDRGYFSLKTFYIKKKILTAEAVVWGRSIKKVFLEISQNLQENTCARESFFIKKKRHLRATASDT